MRQIPIECPNCGRTAGPRALICPACGGRLPLRDEPVYDPLDSLSGLPATPLLQAPDGARIPDRMGLAEWCEVHWQRAALWLNEDLPDQVERIWGEKALAEDMRVLRQGAGGDSDVALDALLRLLDPGFPQPELEIEPRALDFGALPLGEIAMRPIRLINPGRGFLSLHLSGGGWLVPTEREVRLRPGHQQELLVRADLSHLRQGGRASSALVISDQWDQVFEVPVHVTAGGRLGTLVRQLRPPLPPAPSTRVRRGILSGLLGAALVVGGALAIPPLLEERGSLADAGTPTATARPTRDRPPRPTATVGPTPTTGPQLASVVNLNGGRLRVRSEPGTDTEILGMLDEGAQVELLERSEDQAWWRVRTAELEGWVSAEFIQAVE